MSATATVHDPRTIDALRALVGAAAHDPERLATFMRDLAQGVMLLDADGRLTYMNRAALRISGFDDTLGPVPDVETFLGVLEASDPSGRPLPPEEWPARRALRGEPATDVECLVRRRDTGHEWYARYGALPILDERGRVRHVLITVTDLTAHRRAEESLRRRMAFEEVVNRLLARFASSAGAEIDDHIRESLGELGRFVGTDCVFVAQLSDDDTSIRFTHEWCAAGSPRMFDELQGMPATVSLTDWATQQIVEHGRLRVNSLDEVPPEAVDLRAQWEAMGVRSFLEVPLRGRGGATRGGVGLISRTRQMAWADDDIRQLRTLADAISGLLERQRAEEEVRKTTTILQSVIESSRDPIFVKDLRGRYQLANSAGARLVGRPVEEILGRDDTDLLSPEQARALMENDRVAMTRDAAVVVEERLVEGDRTRTFVSTKSPHHDAQGRVIGLIGVSHEITERKQAEEALRASEARHRRLHESMRDAFVSVSMDGRLTDFNETYRAMLGYERDELLRLTYHDLTPERWHAFEQDIVERQVLPRGYSDIYEKEYRRKDGIVIPVELRTVVLRDPAGQPTEMWAIVRDLTERRRAEERLRELVAAVEHAADDILVLDLEGRIQYVNPAFERTTGYPLAEAAGRDEDELLGEGQEVVKAEIWRTIRSGQAWQGRFTNRTRDGRVILLDASVSPIRDGLGRVVGYVTARRDVTKQVEIEQHAARSEKLEAIGTLAGGIAHDFNNILTVIVGFSEMALKESAEGSTIRSDLEAVLDGARRASDLVKQILAFSRQGTPVVGPIQVGPVVQEALKFLRSSIPSTVAIRGDVQTNAVVMADRTDLHRILVNLGTNAALAMPEQGGRIDVSLTEAAIGDDFAAAHPDVTPGRFVRLSVTDDGCGMTREVMARIFEPFFTTRAQGIGTGMGLAVVHGIVQSCRGAVTVESRPGHGTRFDVYLPTADLEAPRKTSAAEGAAGGSERVLVVDDEPLVSALIAQMLGGLGYEVRVYTSGADALAGFEADPSAVDVFITDMTMPGMTGDALARRVKRTRPDLPVILCTGYSEHITAERSRALGIDGFVMKPVLLGDLARLVRQVLDA